MLVLVVIGAGFLVVRQIRRGPPLSPLRARIVSIAEGQVGYRTDPSDTYCNKFSAYWYAGIDDCGNDNLDEEWCADFAAWVWKQAGADGGVPAGAGVPQRRLRQLLRLGDRPRHLAPRRVGLHARSRATSPCTGSTPPRSPRSTSRSSPRPRANDAAPDVVNGDGDRTGYSVVEVGDDQAFADVKRKGAALSGYVSPTAVAPLVIRADS